MTKETFAIFDQYLAGELAEPEKSAFEARLKDSGGLRAEFMEYKISVEALLELPRHQEAVLLAGKLKANLEASYADQFRRYHAGSMPEEEQQAFEQRLSENEWMVYRFEKYSQRQGVEASREGPAARMIRLRPYWQYAAAASLVALVGLATWYFLSKGVDTEQLYAGYDIEELHPKADYALVNEGLLHKGIIDSDDFADLKIKGLEAYEARNWDEAIQLLSEYLRQAKPSEEEIPDEINLVNLYTGRAWLEKGELPKAITALRQANAGITDPANYGLLQELIRWQLALAYLKNDDPASARKIVELLQDAQHETIKEQAIKLLNDLK